MGLDIYVGSLTRYYRRDWETIVQQVGRELGVAVQMVYANEDSDSDENGLLKSMSQPGANGAVRKFLKGLKAVE